MLKQKLIKHERRDLEQTKKKTFTVNDAKIYENKNNKGWIDSQS